MRFDERPPMRLMDARWAFRGVLTFAAAVLVGITVPSAVAFAGFPGVAAVLLVLAVVAGFVGAVLVAYARLLGCSAWREWHAAQMVILDSFLARRGWRW